MVLNRDGFDVVVYENAVKPGGILRYGIPDFKLEKWVIDRRIALMEEEGVIFEIGVEIGTDISLRYLRGRFDAIVLTGGAREPRDLALPGRELAGIHFAMPFLVQQNQGLGGEEVDPAKELTAEGKHVVVIGGGDTGSDCLGTSLRQGALSVRQFEILPRPPDTRAASTPWPLWPDRLRESSSHKEGGERRWSVTTRAFTGDGKRLEKLDCAEVEWAVQEQGGGMVPVERDGTGFTVDADLVLLAMGFVGPGRNILVEELKLERDKRGFLRRGENSMTSEEGVFVAGDMTHGASLVVRAIRDGQDTAVSVARYLCG